MLDFFPSLRILHGHENDVAFLQRDFVVHVLMVMSEDIIFIFVVDFPSVSRRLRERSIFFPMQDPLSKDLLLLVAILEDHFLVFIVYLLIGVQGPGDVYLHHFIRITGPCDSLIRFKYFLHIL